MADWVSEKQVKVLILQRCKPENVLNALRIVASMSRCSRGPKRTLMSHALVGSCPVAWKRSGARA
jgi:hypothetical protein